MPSAQATAVASANIAFVKYWGNLDPRLRLPFNDSLSMNLSAATTTTTVAFRDDLAADEVSVAGEALAEAGRARVTAQLDLVRARAGVRAHARVTSRNTFPMGTGIASSASAYAALTVAAAAAAGLDLTEAELSALARRGSGSAARSVPGGFVRWRAAPSDQACFARSLAPPEHWDLHDVVAVVSRSHKVVGSGGGHAAAPTSPAFAARLAELPARIETIQRALLERDLATLGPAVEAEALSLHAVALTSRPPILYWAPATVAVLQRVATWRAAGLAVYFTLDAGPNVHLLCEGRDVGAVLDELGRCGEVVERLDNRPAGPARLLAPA